MKKLLFFLFGLMLFIACDPKNVEINNVVPTEVTTLELQNLTKDTVLLALHEDIIYIFNKDNKVTSVIKAVGKDQVLIELFVLALWVLLTILLLVFIVVFAKSY